MPSQSKASHYWQQHTRSLDSKINIGLLALCLISTPSHAATCPPLPGVEAILSQPQIKYLLVGDVHGSNEAPALFFDLVCHASAQRRSVTVALEWPTQVDTTLQRYLHTDAQQQPARAKLVQALKPIMIGGLGSRAMFKLVDDIKSLIDRGAPLSVLPFQAFGVVDAAEYEKQMAENIIAAGSDHDLVLVLVGNVHALKTQVTSPVTQHQAYLPMAAYLPKDQTFTIDAAERIGQAWSCNAPEINTKNCRVWPLMSGTPQPRGVWLGYKKPGLFDASYSVGTPFSASLPEGTPEGGAPAF